jgi:stringent starvation protein B
MPGAPPSKKEVMLALLEQSEARVHLDARKPGVVLPAHLLREGHVRLDYGHGLKPAIPDLAVDDQGIRATLSFDRRPFTTFVPWGAVFLIADFDGNGAVWQEDMPTDLIEAPGDSQAPPKKPRPSHLKLVK